MRRSLLLIGAAAALAAACAKGERDEGAMADSAAVAPPAMAPMADAGVQKAVTIYRAIEADPAAAESVLAAHQLTRAGLDSLMYEIAADSARAAAYANAIR